MIFYKHNLFWGLLVNILSHMGMSECISKFENAWKQHLLSYYHNTEEEIVSMGKIQLLNHVFCFS